MMSNESFPESHHDFISPEIITDEQTRSGMLLESKFRDDSVNFRSDLISKLVADGAIGKEDLLGWAIYDIDDNKDMLVIVAFKRIDTPDAEPVFLPHIRMITNEVLRTHEKAETIAEDLTLDEDNDAQFYVDVINLANDGEIERSNAVFFKVMDDGSLTYTKNFCAFTPCIVIDSESVGLPDCESVLPYGTFKCLEDKIYALERGRQLLKQIAGIEPCERSNL